MGIPSDHKQERSLILYLFYFDCFILQYYLWSVRLALLLVSIHAILFPLTFFSNGSQRQIINKQTKVVHLYVWFPIWGMVDYRAVISFFSPPSFFHSILAFFDVTWYIGKVGRYCLYPDYGIVSIRGITSKCHDDTWIHEWSVQYTLCNTICLD